MALKLSIKSIFGKYKKITACSIMSLLLIFYFFISKHDGIIRVAQIIIFMWAFYLFDIKSRFNFKIGHYIIWFLICVFGILFSPLYYIISYYDKILHFVLPIIGSVIIFHVVSKLKISFAWKLTFTLCIMLSCSLVLELVEYSMDKFLGMDLQGVFIYDSYAESYTTMQNSLTDTMADIFNAVLGGIVYTFARYAHYHKNGKKE